MTREELMQATLLALTRQNVIRGADAGGIVRNGLLIWYDGVNNTGDGHSGDTAQWWDLSGNGNHGTISNGAWGDDELIFNGISTWVNCGYREPRTLTIECLMAFDDDPNTWDQIACNYQNGGFGIMKYYGTYRLQVYKDDGWRAAVFGAPGTGRYEMISGTVDSRVQIAYLNGQYITETVYDSPISPPQESTVLALGVNPRRSSPDSPAEWLKGRMKAFRLYDRVLTAEEIAQNYRYDKRRFRL